MEPLTLNEVKEFYRSNEHRTLGSIGYAVTSDGGFVFAVLLDIFGSDSDAQVVAVWNGEASSNFTEDAYGEEWVFFVNEPTQEDIFAIQWEKEYFADAGPGCLRGACPEGAKSCGKVLDAKNERFKDMKEIG